jgi:hypothetical protein
VNRPPCAAINFRARHRSSGLGRGSQSPRAHVVGAWPRLATVVLWADLAGCRPRDGPGWARCRPCGAWVVPTPLLPASSRRATPSAAVSIFVDSATVAMETLPAPSVLTSWRRAIKAAATVLRSLLAPAWLPGSMCVASTAPFYLARLARLLLHGRVVRKVAALSPPLQLIGVTAFPCAGG